MQYRQSAFASCLVASLAASLMNRPVSHDVQSPSPSKSVFVDPVASLYFPDGHTMHSISPAVSWYVPEGQVMHELDARVVASPYVPGGQAVHVVPESRYWPRRHFFSDGAEQAVHPVVDPELHPEVMPVQS